MKMSKHAGWGVMASHRRGGRIHLIRAGKHQVAFLVKGPIYLVCISCTEEPYESLRSQLELLYGQMVLILTESVSRYFEKNPKFDMTPLLGGTDAVFSSLFHSFRNPASFLHAYTYLPLPCATRQAVAAILQDVSDSSVVSLVGAQKAQLHPDDMLLLANFVMTSESFFPICLPRYNAMPFLHAYVHYFDDGKAYEAVQECEELKKKCLYLLRAMVARDEFRRRRRSKAATIVQELKLLEARSFEAPELDISKGKRKLPESEFVDVALLQNRVFDLEQELQENLGGLTALFFDLKQRLPQKFGDEFQPLSAEGEKISASSSGVADPTSQSSSERVVRPAPYANLDSFSSSGPASAQERREKETGKKFIDKYGDRSGIIMWGYDDDKRMRVVKRKSERIEYYEKKVDFLSWTKVDLSELIHTHFHNPTSDTMAWSFKNFLETKAKNNFEGLKIASSFTKKAKGVIDPRTNKTLVNVMWPPTKQAKRIPLPKHLPEGTLD
uniref:Vacuolar fusion protein MON1 homolog n=1 Tax=Lactuca sativa TaxID=4236 RepID=A0A9R1X0L1_LACSA|nr:hypothetical protein LSAT_V11C800400860 [Lactuca sativa]